MALAALPVTGTTCSVILPAVMGPIDPSRLRQLAAELDCYPAQSAETRALQAWMREQLEALATAPTYCASCRKAVTAQLRQQSWMN